MLDKLNYILKHILQYILLQINTFEEGNTCVYIRQSYFMKNNEDFT